MLNCEELWVVCMCVVVQSIDVFYGFVCQNLKNCGL